MIAVAALPLAAGLSGTAFENLARMAADFPVAMTIAAGTSLAAALLAWTTISDNALTFRFSGLRITVQDWPWRSACLLDDVRWTPVDTGARGCMRLGMRLGCLVRGYPASAGGRHEAPSPPRQV